MERVSDQNYYQVAGWMVKRLGLKGVALSVFAIIYSFSQDRESAFYGSLSYLTEFTGATKKTVINALQELCEQELIVKESATVNGFKCNRYFVNWAEILPIINGGDEVEKITPLVKKLHQGGVKITPNNKDNNKYNPPIIPLTGNEGLDNAIKDWLRYKKERKQTYQETALNTFINKCKKAAKRYGADAVIKTIENSISNNYQGVFFDSLKPIDKPVSQYRNLSEVNDD